ncbi:ATP-binding protein [Novosphingobium terrae]|uniref:ATP-binding protein n=1 Tax=Novosphingobium terrae TaxID=2726189 RepID=UPI001980D1AF|nr:ATP-binding protein [Novosphingobium terrae]
MFDSMTSRIFVILLVGIAVAGTLGVVLSETRRVAEVRHIQAIRAIERTGRLLTELESTSVARRSHEMREARRFARIAGAQDGPGQGDAELTALLAGQLPPGVQGTVASIPLARCDIAQDGDQDEEHHRADRPVNPVVARQWKEAVTATDCWRIETRFSDGSRWSLVTGPPSLLRASYGPDPAFLAVIAVAAALLAFVVARTAGAPVRRLTRAAADVRPGPGMPMLAESGPSDVRSAIRAFNGMQQRLSHYAVEQTYMIAAITHDLQTPMTRLRLKLEQMEDAVLQKRLLSDWQAMRAVVDEGLELARSTGRDENIVLLDIDSLIHSIVEDEREAGHVASFDEAAGCDWRCQPQMLRRCIQNLVDNAVYYGGGAHLSTHRDQGGLVILVRDDGPGIPEEHLETVFEPMVRLEDSRSRSTGGTGLGLTIARNLAQRIGAVLTLSNAPEGGLVCKLRFAA